MQNALEKISEIGVLPVIKIEELEAAVPLANALRSGGINAIEVTVRNDIAFDAIKAITAEFPDMVVGAGTIVSTALVDQAMAAGASYVVAPGYNPKVVQYCIEKNVPIVPGCTTPAEIEIAIEAGLKTLKFFPAGPNGGAAALKLLSGPFPQVKFVPTGGVDFTNLTEYARLGCVAAVGGSFMAKADLIKAHDWDAITANCRKAVGMSLGFELAHVGLNHESEEAALRNAAAMDALFGLGVRNGNSSAFCGKAVEFMKSMYYGSNGHIGFYTNSVMRAKAWFRKQSIPIREESVRVDGSGSMVSFYLRDEIGGFAVHVVKRS